MFGHPSEGIELSLLLTGTEVVFLDMHLFGSYIFSFRSVAQSSHFQFVPKMCYYFLSMLNLCVPFITYYGGGLCEMSCLINES